MTKNLAARLAARTVSIGADPSDSDDLRVRKILLVGIMALGTVLASLWAALYFSHGEMAAAAILAGYAALIVVSLWLYGRKRISYYALRASQRSLILVVPFLVTVTLGGVINSSAIILWALIAPVGSAVFGESLREFLRWSAVYLILIVLTAWLERFLVATQPLPITFVTVLFVMNVGCISGMILVLIYYFAYQRALAFRLLHDEQEKSESLLLNILPREIAALLKKESHTVADYHEQASILFADVVDFTPLSARMTPAEVVDLLNEVFLYFDLLVEKHGLEKIKTIGDCYMVAAGVPRPRPDHAQALVRLALEAREYVRQHEFRGRRLVFRTGINSGPIVAGVIGRKKFSYDLWGDAVNTASRMESHGVEGEIQITRATYELIKDRFLCEPRGKICVKGKGEMEVWCVAGEKAPVAD